jgi:hypothetical protein
LVWIKERNFTDSHQLMDTNRGAANALSSDLSFQNNYSPTGLTNFNSNGFSLGSSSYVNGSYNYASWTFREAAKFFDIVTYTGTGSARTIAHSLGVAPGMIFVKRTDATKDWQVYSNGLTSAAYSMQLNLTAAQASAPTVWNSTAPTSSVFSVGTDSTVNASGGTYVAYLYAHDTSSTGIIQCGSFTTDGSGNATVNLGWEPQYVMVKSSSASGSWVLEDIMRGGFDMSVATGGTGTSVLLANSSVAEGTDGSTYNYPTSTGFQVKFNYASRTFIYMAIRRPNKPPTTGTQVFSPIVSSAATGTKLTTNFVVDAQIFAKKGISHDTPAMTRLTGVSTNSTNSGGVLYTNLTVLEQADNLSLGWDNTGVKICANFSGVNAIYWNFARAPGFFDEVCYTGTGVATTQAHNLTVAPEMMIIKSRSNTGSWWVYDGYLSSPTSQYLRLNDTIPAGGGGGGLWNSTAPTSSVFSVGTAETNFSGYTYVAYLFATLAGISKVGSYTGNGTGQAIACGFGSGGARFVLIKRTDSTGGWYTYDSARGLTSGSSPYLQLNSTAVEVTGNNGVYASSGGFTLGATAITTTNIATATYIFLAVA